MAHCQSCGEAALVWHQLKILLTATLGWVHVMRARDLDEAERERAVEAIERNLRGQAKLIDDLLPSCSATAELRADLRALEPAGLIQAAVEDLRPRAAERGIRPKTELAPSLELPADAERLDHVVTILHANAMEATADGEVDALSARQPAEDSGAGSERHALTGVRVLIVDDDPEICKALRLLLERYGAAVNHAGSVAEALAALQRALPDVLLCDVALPGESGYDLVRKVGRGAGFRMHLSKPVEPEALLEAVARLAGRALTKDSVAAPGTTPGS